MLIERRGARVRELVSEDTRMEARGRGPTYIFIDSEPLASAAIVRFLLSNHI